MGVGKGNVTDSFEIRSEGMCCRDDGSVEGESRGRQAATPLADELEDVLTLRTGRERRPVLAATSEASYEFLSSRGRTCSNRLSMDTISTQSRICSRWASCGSQTNIH
ncbi:hypothetical protein EYF80_036323 [Liparis tanakae]|uniref:Uncharacterized protein n=1 Tax=Liparis tanakae TaxID=230148 RepID=A0A4Z2GJV7_9TELE|nr:hypothetical protein EYF80_036323 [Liparis tanakae]